MNYEKLYQRFNVWHLGGGCLAYGLTHNNVDIVITDESGSTIPTDTDNAIIGVYEHDSGEAKTTFCVENASVENAVNAALALFGNGDVDVTFD